MRILVAGATGAIGRPLLPLLSDAGHDVVGTTRSRDRIDRVRRLGAEPAVLDGGDVDAIGALVADLKPDVVINQLTDLPERIDLRKTRESLATTTQLRARAGPALARAAAAAGVRRLISQGQAFSYAPEGDWVKSEEAPLRRASGPAEGDPLAALHALERATLETPGLDGVMLRYGFFYGPGTYYARDGSTARDVLARRYPIVGKGSGVFSFIHVDDAAAATAAAAERGGPGAYNVVDDDPAPLSGWLPFYAEVLGAKKPRRVPLWMARLVAGPAAVAALDLRGASNAKAKRELGWSPRYPSWRQGFREALG
ncbi:MAG TPA: NAD(P)-dependent oxidoreductase [Solirubrobacterales bacterium]|jgi:nucleoside-diphosphate-sugar epimerase|nr:NAD(P)-dependent oxidoreductase [Solirubrobacterales bacterium]